ncbi:MAG: hypothetical protein ACJ76V_00015, partial [Thermoleophilaceae bacterium]
MAAVPMEHLVAAVRALDPGSRALLDLSLRRGVADVEIARLLRTHPAEVALRRARVLDRLAGGVGVNGSGDLLETALHALPPEVWMLSARVERESPPPPPLRPVPESPENPPPEVEHHAPPEVQRPPAPSPALSPPPSPFRATPPDHLWAQPPEPEPRTSLTLRKVAFGGVAVAVIAAAAGVAVGR